MERFHHPVVGELILDFEMLDVPGDPGQKMLVYCAESGSLSQQALDLLASWAATPRTTPVPEDDLIPMRALSRLPSTGQA